MKSGTKLGSKAGLAASRQGPATDTRAAILTAATSIFARSGLDGARLDAIASAAGVNKAVLHRYFKSKDLLCSAILENHFQEFHRSCLEPLSGRGPAGEALLRFVETHFDFISCQGDYPLLFRRLMTTSVKQQIGSLVHKYFMPVAQELFGVLERGQRNGEFRRFDSHLAAVWLMALNVFYFSEGPLIRIVAHIDPYSKRNLKRQKKEVLQFIRCGLFRDPKGPKS